MKSKRAKWLFLLAALLAAGSFTIATSGQWRHAVSDTRAWTEIESNGSFDAYLAEASIHFGSPEVAANTYRDWAVDHWKDQKTIQTSRQSFLTHGYIFDLSRHGAEWTLDTIRSKEGAPSDIQNVSK